MSITENITKEARKKLDHTCVCYSADKLMFGDSFMQQLKHPVDLVTI